MNWEDILQICKKEKDTHVEGYSIGFGQKECIGFKFTDGIIKINDIIKISHVYKIEVHGKDVLWINDNNIIIGLDDINKFEIW